MQGNIHTGAGSNASGGQANQPVSVDVDDGTVDVAHVQRDCTTNKQHPSGFFVRPAA